MATAVALAAEGADVVITGTGRDPSTFPEDEKAAAWRGIESSRPTSPQQSSMMPSTVERLEPLRFSPGSDPLAERRTPVAPAPPRSEPSFMPSISDASMSSSFGYSCSARSYLREIGRNTSVAT